MNIRFITLLFFSSVFIFTSCKESSDATKSEEKIQQLSITDSPEFKDYFEAIYTLSNENTQDDLDYVNDFMTKNRLWKKMGKDQCDLLENEIVKSDKRAFDYWKVRCNFSNAQKRVMEKYKLTYDSLGILTQKAINDKQSNPTVPVQSK
jgi:hypothetical protein